jgi:hypothetical protein
MFRQALNGARDPGLAYPLPNCVFDFAVLTITRGNLERGAVLAAAAQSALGASGMAPMPHDELEFGSAFKGRAAAPAARWRHQPDPCRLRRRDRAGGAIHEYRLVA